MDERQQNELKRVDSVFTHQPKGLVDTAWYDLTHNNSSRLATASPQHDLSEAFSAIHLSQLAKKSSQQRGLLRVATASPSHTLASKPFATGLSGSPNKKQSFLPNQAKQALREASKRGKLAYWNGGLAKKADTLLESKALKQGGVAKLLGERIGPPRHMTDGTVDYSTLGLGQVNFSELAETANSKTPKHKSATFANFERDESDLVRMVTGGTPLDAPAMSNLTPSQLAILQIEKIRARTRGNISAIRESQAASRAGHSHGLESALHFTLRHRSRRAAATAPGSKLKPSICGQRLYSSQGNFLDGDVTYVSDSDASHTSDDAAAAARLPEANCATKPAQHVNQTVHQGTSSSYGTITRNSFKDDLVSLASDATWEAVWTRDRPTVRMNAKHIVEETKTRQSRQRLVHKRAAARREAVRRRHESILAAQRKRAELAATENERKRAARKKAGIQRKLTTALTAYANATNWWRLKLAAQAAATAHRARNAAGRRIARWIERQIEDNLATTSARNRLIVTLFVKRYVRRTQNRRRRRMASAVQNFLHGVKRFGSRTRLLMQSKRYFGAVSIISGAWRRLRQIIQSEQQMLVLLWTKHERHMLQPIYNQLTRAQQRKSAHLHETIYEMEEETLALYDTGLGSDELVQLAVPTPKCIVRRVARSHLFYMRHEHRDLFKHYQSIVEMMQPFLERKRRQLELAQRLAFQGRPSTFVFDESALDEFLPPMPNAFKAFLSKDAVQDIITHTRANLDKRVANADSWYLRRQWK